MAPTANLSERHISEVAQPLDLGGVVGEGTEEVVPPAAQALVAVVAALHPNQTGFDLNLIVHQSQKGIPVAPVEGVSHSVGQLDVLLRHRLLRQPGGFEGFLPSGIELCDGPYALTLVRKAELPPAALLALVLARWRRERIGHRDVADGKGPLGGSPGKGSNRRGPTDEEVGPSESSGLVVSKIYGQVARNANSSRKLRWPPRGVFR